MKPLKIRNLTFGEGIPKICAPVTGTTRQEIETSALLAKASPAQVIEWRADFFLHTLTKDGRPDLHAVTEILRLLRTVLEDRILLFTFRTSSEGGACAISQDAYRELVLAAAGSGCPDLIDVELFTVESQAEELIRQLHSLSARVVLSSHDFHKTPDRDVLLNRLSCMEALGADLAKLAVMPQSAADVLTLLSVTEAFSQKASCPVITMSMGGTGAVSRICGELFGSVLTFGAADQTSAPGQLEVNELRTALEILHRSLKS